MFWCHHYISVGIWTQGVQHHLPSLWSDVNTCILSEKEHLYVNSLLIKPMGLFDRVCGWGYVADIFADPSCHAIWKSPKSFCQYRNLRPQIPEHTGPNPRIDGTKPTKPSKLLLIDTDHCPLNTGLAAWGHRGGIIYNCREQKHDTCDRCLISAPDSIPSSINILIYPPACDRLLAAEVCFLCGPLSWQRRFLLSWVRVETFITGCDWQVTIGDN